MGEAVKNIYQRLHAVMEDVDYIQKEKKSGMNYTIVSHDAVTAKVRPSLVKHGIVYHPHDLELTQEGNRTQVVLWVRFASTDDKTDFIDVPSVGYGIDSQDKGPGKALSYAITDALLKTLGLETGDDADTDSIPHEPTPKTKPALKVVEAEKTEEPISDDGRPVWELWSKTFIEFLGSCKTDEDLKEYRSQNITKLDECEKSYPDLFEKCKQAFVAKKKGMK